MTKEKSPFETRLRALIAAESDLRNGRFSAKEFCESVNISPQAIASMRKGLSLKTLESIVLKYPHWNIVFLIAGKGDMMREELSGLAAEPSSVYQSCSISAEKAINKLLTEHIHTLTKKNEDLQERVGALQQEVRQLEKKLFNISPGDSAAISGAG